MGSHHSPQGSSLSHLSGRVPSELTFAETCEQQSFVPKNQNMQAFLFFCAKNLYIRFFCSNFAAKMRECENAYGQSEMDIITAV